MAYRLPVGAGGEISVMKAPAAAPQKEDKTFRFGTAVTRSAKRVKCRDCGYIPPTKVKYRTCGRCGGVMRVIL